MSEAYAELGGVPRAPQPRLDADAALLVGIRLQALQRVVTWPGTGDRKFLRDVRGKHPDTLSEAQCAHITRLAWRYRFSLRPALRRAADPDKCLPASSGNPAADMRKS